MISDGNSQMIYCHLCCITFAILILSGNMPVHSDWLIMMLSGRDITCSIYFSNLVEILS